MQAVRGPLCLRRDARYCALHKCPVPKFACVAGLVESELGIIRDTGITLASVIQIEKFARHRAAHDGEFSIITLGESRG